jgi:hypothetical protein
VPVIFEEKNMPVLDETPFDAYKKKPPESSYSYDPSGWKKPKEGQPKKEGASSTQGGTPNADRAQDKKKSQPTPREDKSWDKRIFETANTCGPAAKLVAIRPGIIWLLKGNWRAAAVLTQCVYWMGKSSHLPYGSFYKSYSEWEDELQFPRQGIMTAINEIQRVVPGVLSVDLISPPGKEHLVTAYHVNYELLLRVLQDAQKGIRPSASAGDEFEEMVKGHVSKEKGE